VEPTFTERLAQVEARIRQALERSGRIRSDVELVAVSKKFSAGVIREAYGAGVRVFGENYLQEFQGKKPLLRDLSEARYHLIGHLQANKARAAAQLFDVIETVDSERLLRRLDAIAGERSTQTAVLLEVKLSEEAAKTGASRDELDAIMAASGELQNVRVVGLMTVPPWSTDAEQSRPFFQELAHLGRRYGLPQLSMGMSNDFEVAIEEGATTVRVGTALFGARPRPEPAPVPSNAALAAS
jgi:PLP dependent protein